MNWILTEDARDVADRMGLGEKEVIKTCEDPDWAYKSNVYLGAKVALGGRLAVAYDETNRLVLHVSWRYDSWRQDLG
jgi:hypothetical protein